MSQKPTWLNRSVILAIGVALIAAGHFTPVYQTVEKTIGVEWTKELFAWIISEKEEQEKVESGETPIVVNPPDEQAPADILANASWGPKKEGNPAKARIVCTLKSAIISGGQVRITDDRPSWPRKFVSGDEVEAVIYIGVQVDGQWRVSKFEWLRPGQRSKTLHNIATGYTGLPIGKGSQVLFVIASVDGRERSTASPVVEFK